MNFQQMLDAITQTNGQQIDQVYTQAMASFRQIIQAEQTIRIFVGGTPGYGHAQSSIYLLNVLTAPANGPLEGMDYAHDVEIYYQQFAQSPDTPTLTKVQNLLYNATWTNQGKTQGTLYNANFTLIQYDDNNPPGQQVQFGFTGGADSNVFQGQLNSDQDFRSGVNVQYFLRLQPYLWSWPNQLQTAQANTDLNAIQEVGANEFEYLGYKMPQPVIDWQNYFQEYIGNANLTRVGQIVQWLTTQQQLQHYDLFFVYGYRWYDIQGVLTGLPQFAGLRIYDSLCSLIGGVLGSQWQNNAPRQNVKPAIIINLDAMDWGFSFLQYPPMSWMQMRMFYGGPSLEDAFQFMQANSLFAMHDRIDGIAQGNIVVPAYTQVQQFFDNIDAVNQGGQQPAFDRIDFLTAANVDLNALQAKCNQWLSQGNNDRTLFLQLGNPGFSIPNDLFQFALSQSQFPPAFEGANTLNRAITLSNGYLKINRQAQNDNFYPDTPPTGGNGGQEAVALQTNANIMRDTFDVGPAQNLGTFLRTFMTEGAQGAYHAYFTQVFNYFTAARNDKMRRGLLYLLHISNPQEMVELLSALAGGTPKTLTLDQIYTAIENDIKSSGQVALSPGLFDQMTDIGNYYTTLLKSFGGSLIVTKAQVEKETSGQTTTSVTLTGKSDAFMPGMTVTYEFKDNEDFSGVVQSIGNFAQLNSAWDLDGIPWIPLENPFLTLNVSNSALPPLAWIGAQFKGTDLQLAIALPVQDGKWLFKGQFVGKPPGLETIYQLCGGVNLLNTLPQSVATLGGLSILSFEAMYNSNDVTLQYISVNVGFTEPLPLMSTLTLKDFNVNFAVTNPASLKTRSTEVDLKCQFQIGSGKNPGVIGISAKYPEYSLNGQLLYGIILIEDLLNIFLPGVQLSLPTAPNIDQFAFSYSMKEQNYSVSCNLNINWPITISGKEILNLQSIKFSVAGKDGDMTGMMQGSVAVLPGTQWEQWLQLTASYLGSNKGWKFEGSQVKGELSISDMLTTYVLPSWKPPSDIAITNLRFSYETESGSYSFGAETKGYWSIPFPIGDNPQIKASVFIQYDGSTTGALAELSEDSQGRYSGKLSAEIKYYFIDIKLSYNFNPDVQSYELKWGALTALLTEKTVTVNSQPQKQWIADITLKDLTVGDIVETMISWFTGQKYGLSSPWDVLNKISLDGLELSFNFTTSEVSLKIPLNLNLGVVEIKNFDLTYEPTGTNKGVNLSLEGSFPWLSSSPDKEGNTDKKLGWDTSDPSSTPAPPGNGSKYFDLRLLALGQHVSVKDLQDSKTVEDAITLLQNVKVPQPGEIPVTGDKPPSQSGVPYFAADSSWLIAMDFGILKVEEKQNGNGSNGGNGNLVLADDNTPKYLVTLEIVFNDPNIYGLRIALDGPAAKIFAGLDFEILYRKVSDTVGVYQAQIKLPDAMREFTIGAYSLTLPIFAVQVYTNGDFLIDVGFPWNEDFSRSLTVQGIIAPGIPVIGSAGFYFGKLSSATTNKVPDATNGAFNPVIVFGFGISVGIGKTFQLGILSGGFSLTMLGIIQGVIGKWNPNTAGDTGTSAANQVQGAYYFWLQGTVGLQGKLYGSVNFAIIQADLNIDIKLLVSLTYESYASIVFTASASVSVSLSVKINLGLFKISISFAFSASVKVTFTIQLDDTDKPWHVPPSAAPGLPGTLNEMHQKRLRWLQEERYAFLASESTNSLTPIWTNLEKPTTAQPLTGYYTPMLTISAPEGSTTPSDQSACFVNMFFIESSDPTTAQISATSNTSFELLAMQTFRWVLAAMRSAPIKASDLDKKSISASDLDAIYNYFENNTSLQPFEVTDVDTFLGGQFTLSISVPTNYQDSAVFPMIPALTLDVPAYDGSQALNYTFADFNSVDDQYIEDVKALFDQLAVQVEREMGNGNDDVIDIKANPTTLSVGSFLYEEYFILIAKQMIKSAQDALRNFNYLIINGETPDQIIKNINTTGQLTGEDVFTPAELFDANKAHPLSSSKTLTISKVMYSSSNTDTLDSIADTTYEKKFTAVELATTNEATTGIWAAGQLVTYPGQDPHVISANDSLNTIAESLGKISIADLVSKSNIASTQGMLIALSTLTLPDFDYSTASGETDTLEKVAALWSTSVDELADVAGNLTITDLFYSNPKNVNQQVLNVPHLVQYQIGAIIDEIKRTQGLQHLSGMASRFFTHGLRLPTKGVTQNVPSMCGANATECGLYALTGQQFPIPALNDKDTFDFSLAKPDSADWDWLTLPDGTKHDQIDISVAPKDEMAFCIASLLNYADKNILDLELTSLGVQKMFSSQPTNYNFAAMKTWQSAGEVTLPYGTKPSTPLSLRIWSLPENLVSLPHPYDDSGQPHIRPRFSIQVGSFNEATGRMVNAPVSYYSWGTQVELTIKKNPEVSTSPTTQYTYELLGSAEADIVLLERLIGAMGGEGDDSWIDNLALLYQPSTSGGDDGTSGLFSDGQNVTSMFISQANLSTDTHPPSGSPMDEADTLATTPGCYNTPYDFLKLLWECSITRSGGFYLYYYNSDSQQGLPSEAFNDKGEATLTLLITYSSTFDNGLDRFMNCAVTGESIETSKAHVFAQANPNATTATSGAKDKLEAIAELYYMNPIQVAEDNAGVSLRSGVKVKVKNGLYLVRSAAPGQTLSDIATYFGTTSNDIQKANTQIPDSDWANWEKSSPDPIPLYTALYLPTITVDAGTTAGGTTLESIAAYYGAQIGELAVDNQSVPGLLDGTLQISGGPNSRSATVPPGAVGVEAVRTAPAAVPAQPTGPTDDNWATIYLRNMFTMLGYQVMGNFQFSESPTGLPMGAIDPPSDDDETEKIRVAKLSSAGDPWNYQKAVPFSNFSIEKSLILPGFGPSPYDGVGDLLQIDFDWVDIFGNRAITSLSQADRTKLLNRSPVLIGFTDAIVGFDRWASISSSYQIEDVKGTPSFEITLQFDTSRYDPTKQKAGVWEANATQDLRIYEILEQQFAQLIFKFDSSLFIDGPFDLSSEKQSLKNWLFAAGTSTTNSIYSYLYARSQGTTTTPDPVITFTFSKDIDQNDMNTAQIYKLTTELTASRLQHLVSADFKDSPDIYHVVSKVPPLMTQTTTQADGTTTTDTTYRLREFASNFESTLSVQNKYKLKVATGIDRKSADPSPTESPLWVVRLGINAGTSLSTEGINYEITNPTAPRIFAPRPISNKLESYSQIPIYDYQTGKPIDYTTPSQKIDFTGIDMDVWMSEFLSSIDSFLAPELISPAGILSHLESETYLQDILGSKKSLAGLIKELVIPVFENEPINATELEDAQESFEQQVLVALANTYSVEALIQYDAQVNADIPNTNNYQPAKLYGVPSSTPPGVTIGSAKLTLDNTTQSAPHYLTFPVSANPQFNDKVAVDFQFAGSNIEHQISELHGIVGYDASAWLSFIIEEDLLNSTQLTGEVPLILRAFPTPPSMISQLQLQSNTQAVLNGNGSLLDGNNINDLMEWDYGFDYGLDYHYAQDQINFEVIFNVQDSAQAELTDAQQSFFGALAQFITVFPNVHRDFDQYVQKIKGSGNDSTDVTNAKFAIEAFIGMVQNVVTSWTALPDSQSLRAFGSQDQPYQFYVREDSITFNNKPALLVEITNESALPSGIGTPYVSIDGYTPEPHPPKSGDTYDYGYIYKNGSGYLTPEAGRPIADRQVVLPDMNILARQDAITSANIIRNQDIISGKTTAEPFVYTTSEVEFVNPFHPVQDVDTAVNIAEIGAQTPQKRTLAEHLSILFETLFANDPQATQTLQLECRYFYDINENLPEDNFPNSTIPRPLISLPVLLVPPTEFNVQTDWKVPQNGCSSGYSASASFVCNLSNAINSWTKQNSPATNNGTLWIDLTILSDLTEFSMPLLRFRNLVLQVDDINP